MTKAKKENWYLHFGSLDNENWKWLKYYGTERGAKLKARKLREKYPDDIECRIYHRVDWANGVAELRTGYATHCPII